MDAIAEDKDYIDKLANIASFFLSTFNDQHKQGWDLEGHSKIENNQTVPDTINFFGQSDLSYQYRYDPDSKSNYLYRYDSSNSGELLSGVQIIAAMEVNVKFNEVLGDRYLAAATSKQYDETSGTWKDMEWGNRTGDGTNAVYMSELFNISMETILSDNKANASVYKNSLLRNKDGNFIDENGNVVSEDKAIYATSMSKLSLNAYYQKSMSNLGINAYSTDVNYEAMQNIMTQVQNWRDSTAGVDWNEELTNMIKFQKGFVSCSRCLNAMDEILDRLVNSTGVVGR